MGSENSTTPKPRERPVRPSILTIESTIVPQLLKVSASCSVVISYGKFPTYNRAAPPKARVGLPLGWFSARPRERLRERDRRRLELRFLDLLRERSFLRRERLRLRLRERLLLPSSSFSALLERERLLLLETDEASESSSLAMAMLGVSRGDGVSCYDGVSCHKSRSWINAGFRSRQAMYARSLTLRGWRRLLVTFWPTDTT